MSSTSTSTSNRSKKAITRKRGENNAPRFPLSTNLLVITHVSHEGLGTLEEVFRRIGCGVRCLQADHLLDRLPSMDSFDGLIVMGGPMGVYEQRKFPFLKRELVLLEKALQTKRPILGICLGAQLLAHALGSSVTKNPRKEIGWYPLMREPTAQTDPIFSAFESTETVFQWHGDTFSLPKGALRLASSPLCQEQAFRYEDNAYGLQFHVEVTEAMVLSWLKVPENRQELDTLKDAVDPEIIRKQSKQHFPRLKELSTHVAHQFLGLLPAKRGAS